MNSLTIPPSPNWYQSRIATCAPDNTLIYGSNSSLVVVKPSPSDKPADISAVMFAHLDRISGICLGQWSDTKKQLATFGDDKLVKLWNMLDNTVVNSHNSHTISRTKLIGGAFAGEHKIVSVSEDGLIVIWRINTDEKVPIKNLLGIKTQVTSVSSCPHASWLMAFGMRNGLIIVADLRYNGSVMYKLRSHDHDVIDLAWCPVPYNVFPKKNAGNAEVKDSSEDSSGKNGSEDKGSSLEESTNSELSTVSKIIGETAETGPQKESGSVQADTVDASIFKNAEDKPPQEKPKEADGAAESSSTTKTEKTGDTVDSALASKIKEVEISETKTEEMEDVDTVDALPANGTHLINCTTEEELVDAHQKVIKSNPWVDLKHADDDEQPPEESETSPVSDTSFDFLKECNDLEAKIREATEEGTHDDHKTRHIVQDTPEKISNSVEKCDEAEKKPCEIREFLLASSAKGGCICIWRAGTDGRLHMKLNPPKSKSHGRKQHHRHHRDSSWITLNWISPDTLLSSGCNGELYRWDLLERQPQAILVHNDHHKQLFSMCSPAYSALALHQRPTKKEDLAIWTMGRDRNIIYTSVLERKVLCIYPTLGCAVYTMCSSPIDPNRVALGLGDGSIRVWDLSKPHLQFILMSEIKLKVGARVMSLAWHPNEEFVLAYGTEEGQVGYVNPGSVSKPPALFAQHFRSAIYNLEWAPFPDKPDTLGLYVCSEGTVGIFDLNNTIAGPAMLILPKKEFITQIAWRPDHAVLALGCKSGAIYLLNGSHQVESTIYYQKKGISCLSWHPVATAEDDEESANKHWLASSTSSDNGVVIYNTDVKPDGEDIKGLVVEELSSHVKPVNQIMWSPYKNGRLVTISEDGTAVVWVDMKPVATFVNSNTDPLLAGIWSTVSEHFIITAGKDTSLRVWNISDNPYVEQSEVDNMRTTRKKVLQQFKGKREERMEEQGSKGKRCSLFPNATGRQGDLSLALRDCRALLEKSETAPGNGVLQMFGNPDELGGLMDEQSESFKNRGKHTMQQYLSLWRGNIGDAVKEAIADGNLSPWLISIAPMVSFKLWQEACEAYTVQLMENPNSDPLEIASYYLSAHKVDEAVGLLCERQMYSEALALSKKRKPNDEQSAKEIMHQWAKNALINGRFEVAAQNYIALGEFEEAAKVLYKRSDCESLALAVDLAKRCNNPELLATITHRYNLFKNKDDLVALPTILDATLKLTMTSEEMPSQCDDKEKVAMEIQ